MTATCPAAAAFDPFATDYLADPYPFLAAVREEAPAFHAPALGMWVVTRYDDIDAVFADPATFSARIAQDPVFPLAPATRDALGPDFPLPRTMSDCDPPEHARIRRFNLRSFSARRTAVLEPKVRAAAENLIDTLLRAPRADLVAGLTYPLPAYMIFTLIGFPAADTELLKIRQRDPLLPRSLIRSLTVAAVVFGTALGATGLAQADIPGIPTHKYSEAEMKGICSSQGGVYIGGFSNGSYGCLLPGGHGWTCSANGYCTYTFTAPKPKLTPAQIPAAPRSSS